MSAAAPQQYVLLTRAARDCAAYVDVITRHGFLPLDAPMLWVELKADAVLPDLSGYQALVFTSASGVEGYCAQTGDRSLPVYTVGEATAEKARAAGFTAVTSAMGNVTDLTDLLREKKPGRLLYLRGEDIARPLTPLDTGCRVDSCIVYKAHPAERLPAEVLEKLEAGQVGAVALFSRRGAQALTSLLTREGLESRVKTIKALCLGDSMLESVAGFPWGEIYAAECSDRQGMLDLLERILDE